MAIRFSRIKIEPGQSRISINEFRRQQIGPESSLGNKKGRHGKYNAIAIDTEYGRFDSKMEFNRFLELQILEKSGLISNLEKQVRYPLVVEGDLICTYIADFVYVENGDTVVEDSKGFRTREYLMKKKLMKTIYNIDILETGSRSVNKNKKREKSNDLS